jgi:hypothetical protein
MNDERIKTTDAVNLDPTSLLGFEHADLGLTGDERQDGAEFISDGLLTRVASTANKVGDESAPG